NGARVANDALGVLLATAAVALGFALALGRGPLGRRPAACALALGLTAGLAALAKATNLALMPFAAACWLVRAVRGRGGGRGGVRVWLAGVLLAAGWVALMQDALRFNLAHSGQPPPMQEALLNRRAGRSAADLLHAAAAIPWNETLRRLWLRELFF